MKKNLRKLSFAVAALAGVTLFSSCLNKDDNNNSKPQAGLFIMHAAPGIGGTDIYFNKNKVSPSVFRYTYHATTAMTPADYTIAFAYPVSEDGDTLASVTDSLSGGSLYSAILYDTGSAVKMMFFKDQYENAQSSGATFLRFLQLSPINDAVTINIDNDKEPFTSGRHFADNVSQPDLAKYKPLSNGPYNITALNGQGDTLGHLENAELTSGGYYTLYLSGYSGASVDSLGVQLRVVQSY